jgi:hypothetical protein
MHGDRMGLLEHWGWHYPVENVAHGFHAELQRELPPGHLLYGRAVEVIAYREDRDEVLFRHLDEPDKFTVIHLTWLRKREINAQFPSVCFDGTFEEFFAAEKQFHDGGEESGKN